MTEKDGKPQFCHYPYWVWATNGEDAFLFIFVVYPVDYLLIVTAFKELNELVWFKNFMVGQNDPLVFKRHQTLRESPGNCPLPALQPLDSWGLIYTPPQRICPHPPLFPIEGGKQQNKRKDNRNQAKSQTISTVEIEREHFPKLSRATSMCQKQWHCGNRIKVKPDNLCSRNRRWGSSSASPAAPSTM